jgi:hypothetical protein
VDVRRHGLPAPYSARASSQTRSRSQVNP